MSENPTKPQFAEQLIAAIREIEPSHEYVYDADDFKLVRVGESGEINLSNMYVEHCKCSQDEREDHLHRIASIFGGSSDDLPVDFETAKSHLRPKVWARATIDFHRLKARIDGEEGLDFPLYPLGDHLYCSLVYDTETAMRSLSQSELDHWGVTYYDAMQIACRNLDEETAAFVQIGDHFTSSISGDNYDSSRVLLTGRIGEFEVLGQHVAVVPQRDAMYVAGTEDESSLRIMFDFARQDESEDYRPLSPLPLILRDGEWVDWEPPKNHLLRERFDELELNFLGGLYHEQKELLDRLFEWDVDNAAFVASFSGLRKEGSEKVSSYCVWGAGVDALLPKTQLVMFAGGDGLVASGEWDHVRSVVGDLMVPDERYYPMRYRVREFPSDQQLAEIGSID